MDGWMDGWMGILLTKLMYALDRLILIIIISIYSYLTTQQPPIST